MRSRIKFAPETTVQRVTCDGKSWLQDVVIKVSSFIDKRREAADTDSLGFGSSDVSKKRHPKLRLESVVREQQRPHPLRVRDKRLVVNPGPRLSLAAKHGESP